MIDDMCTLYSRTAPHRILKDAIAVLARRDVNLQNTRALSDQWGEKMHNSCSVMCILSSMNGEYGIIDHASPLYPRTVDVAHTPFTAE